jgi:hypothetical protein
MNADIFARIEAAGEALKASGEGQISIRYDSRDDMFSVGVASHGPIPDTYGHAQSARVAFAEALDRRENRKAA